MMKCDLNSARRPELPLHAGGRWEVCVRWPWTGQLLGRLGFKILRSLEHTTGKTLLSWADATTSNVPSLDKESGGLQGHRAPSHAKTGDAERAVTWGDCSPGASNHHLPSSLSSFFTPGKPRHRGDGAAAGPRRPAEPKPAAALHANCGEFRPSSALGTVEAPYPHP